jgi:hypothetical protein
MTFRPPIHFRFIDLIAMARSGRFDPAWFREPISLDLSALKFADAGAMACIKALLANGQRYWPQDTCTLVSHEAQDAVRYLTRMDFFTREIRWCRELGFEVNRYDATGRFLPIRNMREQRETPEVAKRIVQCLEIKNHASANTIKYALSEIIDNALQHSESPAGTYVTAQLFPKLDCVDAVIADTGIGLRGHLARHPQFRGLNDDIEALRIALTPNVTGVYIPDRAEARLDFENENQGIGLSVTDHIIKRSAGGVLYVWSGRALYRSNAGVEEMPVSWPGTVVFLHLPRSISVDHLQVIREIHVPLRRRRRGLRFD